MSMLKRPNYETQDSQVKVPFTFKWFLKSWFLSKDAFHEFKNEQNLSNKRFLKLAATSGWNAGQPPVLVHHQSPSGPATDTQGISAKLASSHCCWITIILNRPLHPISKLSKICLFFLVHRTSETLFTSLSLDWAEKLHLAKNSPTCNALTKPVHGEMACICRFPGTVLSGTCVGDGGLTSPIWGKVYLFLCDIIRNLDGHMFVQH